MVELRENKNEEKSTSQTHPTTTKVLQLLKKNSRITDQEIADELGLKSEQAARGWRVVAEETLKGWKWGY